MRSAHLGRDQNSPKEFWAEPPVLEAEAFSVSGSQQGFVHLAACPDSSELPTSRPGFPEPRQSAEARPPQPPLTQTLQQVAPSSATIDPQPEHPIRNARRPYTHLRVINLRGRSSSMHVERFDSHLPARGITRPPMHTRNPSDPSAPQHASDATAQLTALSDAAVGPRSNCN